MIGWVFWSMSFLKISPLESVSKVIFSFSLPFILSLTTCTSTICTCFGVLSRLIPLKLVFPKTLFSFLSHSSMPSLASLTRHIPPYQQYNDHSVPNSQIQMPLNSSSWMYQRHLKFTPSNSLSSSVHSLAFNEWILTTPSTSHVFCSSL